MKNIILQVSMLLVFGSAFSQTKDDVQIRNILNQQAIAWSSGNIESFMEPYWHNDSLLFIGKSGITYGWQQALDRYKKNYPDATAMGKLDFTILHTKRLSVLYYFVVGKWHLGRTMGNLDGHFTLLFKKIKDKWVIVSDHSS